MARAFVVGVLGAEGTGKTTLAHRLAAALAEEGQHVAVVSDGESTEAAAETHDLVIADMPPSMGGTMTDQLGRCGLVLLTALDPVDARRQEATDARLRDALSREGLAWSVVVGSAEARLAQALAALARARAAPSPEPVGARWRWSCDRCDDAGCEHRLLPVWSAIS